MERYSNSSNLLKYVGVSILLFLIWFMLSGRTEPKFIIIGAAGSIIISLMTVPALIMQTHSGHIFIPGLDYGRFFIYFIWLLKEIIMSSLDVMKVVLWPSGRMHSQLIRFTCPLDNPTATVLFINSIILTPGTVTIDVYEDENGQGSVFIVNALTDGAAKSLVSGEMLRMIAWVYHLKEEA